MNYDLVDSPVGPLVVAADDAALREIRFADPKTKEASAAEDDWKKKPNVLVRQARKELGEYFRGARREFAVPIGPNGTGFQMKVWAELLAIPYGVTISYGELAERVGNPNAQRAVGLANGRNRIPIVIPCHRVIGANGRLTGFGGGIEAKGLLLELEQGSGFLFAAEG